MAVYSVCAIAKPQVMDVAIKANYQPEDYFLISPGHWFVYSQLLTPRDISIQLVPNNEADTFLVTPVSSYYGFYNPKLWDWLKSKGM